MTLPVMPAVMIWGGELLKLGNPKGVQEAKDLHWQEAGVQSCSWSWEPSPGTPTWGMDVLTSI